MRFVYLDSTIPDLAWYRMYYQSVFPAGARLAAAQYLKAMQALRGNPLAGPVVADHGIRRYVVRRTPFSIYYRVEVEHKHIEIVRIWDQRADPKNLEFHEEATVFA